MSPRELPLFPLRTVLFPGGLLGLKVFEARYLDMVSACLRNASPFGVVTLSRGAEAGRDAEVQFEAIGVLAEPFDVDSAQAGILQLRCRGTQRFTLDDPRQQADGLWIASTTLLPGDEAVAPPEAMVPTVKRLAQAIGTLKEQGAEPFLEPFRFDNAGWVANRWCEILPIPLTAKHKLMALPDPLVRLKLVDDFLRSKGVIA